MIVMIIFLILTIVFVIATAIYLNYKKKSNNVGVKKLNQPKVQNEGKKKRKKQLANLLDIKVIDNIVCLDNRYSYILKLGSIDYNMLSNKEQESIENILIQTALAIDFPIQFFSTTEFIDTSKIVELIKTNKPKSSTIQEYKNYLIEYLQNLMENRTISVVKNYAVISYDGLYENAVEELNRKSASFRGNLLRGKIDCEVLDEDGVYNLIYRELNKNSAISISPLKKGGKNLYVGKKQKKKRKRD